MFYRGRWCFIGSVVCIRLSWDKSFFFVGLDGFWGERLRGRV